MAKLTFKINPVFILFSFVLIYFGWFYDFLIYFTVLILHEFAHYFMAKRLGYVLNTITLMPYGAGLGGKNQVILRKHEILISLAGPVFNLILVIICLCLWWVFPLTFYYTETFVISNLSLAIFNLLPVFPLDGGRIFVCVLSNKINTLKVYKLMKILGCVFSAVFAILFVASVFYKVNLTLFFISVFLFLSCFENDTNIYFERVNVNNFKKEINEPMQVKSYVVSAKTPLYKMLKFITPNQYAMFYLYDKNKLIKVLTETDVLTMLKLTENEQP